MFLLAMLRRAKFSQLEARRLIENILTAKTLFPEYMSNVDIQDPGVLAFIEKGVIVYPPKADKEGRKMAIIRLGQANPDDPLLTPINQVRCSIGLGEMLRESNEDTCVNGWQFVLDCTGVGPKHLTRMPMEFHRKMSKIFQDSNPERVKGFHYYNVGTIIEVIMSMVKQFMKKKHQDRVQVHDTMESLYKAIPMELWPDEYLPDDYKGPSAGSIANIAADLKKRMMDPATRKRILDHTSDRYKIDESKRPSDPTPNESFRKLNLD
jgi:hypothetical protein